MFIAAPRFSPAASGVMSSSVVVSVAATSSRSASSGRRDGGANRHAGEDAGSARVRPLGAAGLGSAT